MVPTWLYLLNNSANPILVEVTRGDMVESFHRGAAAVVGQNDQEVAAYGNVDSPIYPRSAIKPLQAIVLAESGALQNFHLSNEHIALACASHSGQSMHVDRVRYWLDTIGLDETALHCGTHAATHRNTRLAMIREQKEPNALYNNCSGKHAGFLTVAVHNNEPVAGYTERSHPVQQRVLKLLQDLTGEAVKSNAAGIDGCGIPVVGMSLRGIARAFAKIASADFISPNRRQAAIRIKNAMAVHPDLVGGDNRFCTAVPLAVKSRVLVKVGAEGVYAGMTTDDNPIGFALKIDDGSRRAAEVAAGWVITKFCNVDTALLASLNLWFRPIVRNVANKQVGVIRPSLQ